MAWLLEGGHADELPEALLGTVRFNFVDLNRYRYVDEHVDQCVLLHALYGAAQVDGCRRRRARV